MVRKAYLRTIADMELEGIEVSNPIHDMESLFSAVDPRHDGIIFDYQLKATKYSPFNGDTFGIEAYRREVPFIISSHFQPLSMDGQRRYIPRAIQVSELEPETILDAFSICIEEYQGKFSIQRQPVRTLVRIESLEEQGASCKLSVVVPNWNHKQGVLIQVDSATLPDIDNLRREFTRDGEARLTAEVNTGALEFSELYFVNWRSL
jgi:hypothetical protein